MLIASEKTVAIAVPGAIARDWVVLAITPLDPAIVERRLSETATIETLSEDGFTMPKSLHRVEPVYPRKARDERLEGRVVLRVVIDTEGIPRAPTVVSMTEGAEELAGSAVDAVQQWRYAPATRDGKPVPVWFHVVVQFRLRSEPDREAIR